jgi:hypothetical protein
MAVKLFGLPREKKDQIYAECRYFGTKAPEYFKENGIEIKSIADLRKYALLFLVPSGNTFIYRVLSWLARTPITDDDEFVAESERCEAETHGNRCCRKDGHAGKHKALVWAEF